MMGECRRAALSTAQRPHQKKRGVLGIRAGRTCSHAPRRPASPLYCHAAFLPCDAKRLAKYLEIDIPLIIPAEDASLASSGEI